MSAKDVIVGVLKSKSKKCTRYINNPNGEVDEVISYSLEFTPDDIAQQILDSLPKLSRDRVEKVLEKNMTIEVIVYDNDGNKTHLGKELDWDRAITDICSLIPEHKWVQTTDDKGNVIVPLGEVVATGKVKDDAFEYAGGYKIGGKDIDSFFYEHHNQSGTLVWVPDKEEK